MIEFIFKAILICIGLLILLPIAALLLYIIATAIAAIGPVNWGVVLDIALIVLVVGLVIWLIAS